MIEQSVHQSSPSIYDRQPHESGRVSVSIIRHREEVDHVELYPPSHSLPNHGHPPRRPDNKPS